jgi:hypothetical protein
MKKTFYILLFIFLLTPLFSVFSASEVYVYPVAVDKTSYGVGDTINGQFTIHNVKGVRQSDVLYSIAVTQGEDPYSISLGEVKSEEKLYLEANSKRIIPFTYTLPTSVSGKKNIVVTAYLTDGTIVAQGSSPLSIKGVVGKNPLLVQNPVLQVGEESFGFQEAPLVSASDTAAVVFTVPKSTTTGSISAKVQLFNRTDIETNFIKELELVNFTVNEKQDTLVKIPVPTDLNPLVYAGKISFSSEEFEVPSLVFRYVIDGPIATIRNINSDKLTVKKNKKFTAEVIYAGPPIDQNASSEDVLKNATLKIRATNEKGEEVAYFESLIDLINQTSVQIPLTAQVSAEKIAFNAQIVSEDGTVVSSFSTNLPSEEELKQWYQKDFWDTYKYILSFAFLCLILILLSLFLKKKKIKMIQGEQVVPMILIFSVLLFANEIVAQVSTGYQVESGSASSRGAEVNAIFSPLPPAVRSYAPGEYFDIAGDARFGATLSTGASMSIFLPRFGPFQSPSAPLTNPTNWAQSHLDYYAAWWVLQPPSSLFNLAIPTVSVSPYDSSTLFGWMNQNYVAKIGSWAVNASGNNIGGNYVSFDNLSSSIANDFLDLRKVTYPTNNTRVFADGVSLGYMGDSTTFERELQVFFRTNGLGSVYQSCYLREAGIWTGQCPTGETSLGTTMKDLYPPVLSSSPTYPFVNQLSFNGTLLRYPVLISKYRAYEILNQAQKDAGMGQKPFGFEKNNFQTSPDYAYYDSNYYSNNAEIRNLYKNEIEFLLIAAKFMEDYQITGWQDIANFDFGGTLSQPSFNTSIISIYDPYTYSVSYDETRIDEIAASEYNSVEFNRALKALFDFTFYYNQKFFTYSKQYSASSLAAGNNPSLFIGTIINMYTSFHSRISSNGFQSAPTSSYWVPPLPGVKKAYAYLYLNNWSSSFNLNNKELLISQSVCIRGAGICPDETQNLVCPNLMDAVYTKYTGAGLIYRDGVPTTLVEDGSGNCIESTEMCNLQHFEGEITYTYQGQGPYGVQQCTQTVWSCGNSLLDGSPEWQGETSPINCYDPEVATVSCRANPISIEVGGVTTFEAVGRGGIVAAPESYPNNYIWEWSEYSNFSIIDPGNFDLGWILAPGDTIEELENCPYLTQEEIKIAIQNKRNVDQLYLVKWRGLCYN